MHTRPTHFVVALGFVAFVCASCSDDKPALTVDVVSGVVPGAQFNSVQVELFTGSAVESALSRAAYAETPASFGDDYVRGHRVAVFSDVGQGVRTVVVRLMRTDLSLVLQRRVTVQVDGNFALRVHMTPNCIGVTCPSPAGNAGFSECLDGACVDPRCNPPTSVEFCGTVAFCNDASTCANTASCATPLCLEGVCDQEPRADACLEGEFCDPTSATGCEPLPSAPVDADVMDAGTDAPMPSDAGPDSSLACGAICIDATNPCLYGTVDCSGGMPTCNATFARPGAACGSGQVCGLHGECVDCVEDASCQAECSTGHLRCGSGTPTCVATEDAMRVTAGTPCVPSCASDACPGVFVCTPAGTCASCVEGDSCFAGCDNGSISCAAGGECISDSTPAPEFTVCGASTYCDGRGECLPCVDNAPYTTLNMCGTGTLQGCSTSPFASVSAHVDPSTECDDGVCSGDGYCYPPFIALDIATNGNTNDRNTCAIRPDHHVMCWGSNNVGTLGWGETRNPALHQKVEVVGINDAVQIRGDDDVYCVRRASGQVWCWGESEFGTIGDGTLVRRYAPVRANVPGTAVDLDVGRGMACAVLSDGQLACWGAVEAGYNWYMAGPVDRALLTLTPALVPGIADAIQVSIASGLACVRHSTGHISCFGYAGYPSGDRVGDGVTRGMTDYIVTPVEVVGIDDATAISVGDEIACAIRAGSSLWCWGSTYLGDLGYLGSLGNPGVATSNVPVQATALMVTDLVSVEAGTPTCVVQASGDVSCWSDSPVLQLGRGSYAPSNPHVPTPVLGMHDFVRVSYGGIHICGLSRDGVMTCWGYNTWLQGELGIGHDDAAYRDKPTVVMGVTP